MLIDQNGTLGLCYSNKYIETYLRDNLTDAEKEQIREPKRNFLILYEKPLAVLNITGWGRTHSKTRQCGLLQPGARRRHGKVFR